MDNTETPRPSLVQHAAKFGAIMSACSISIVIIFYIVSLCFLGTFKFIGLIIVLGLGMVIYGGITYRGEIGGYIPYGKAFLYGLTLLAVGGMISAIFNMILYQMVDPELPQKLTDCIVENTEAMMRNFGAPEDRIEQTISEMKEEMPGNFTYGGLAFGYIKVLPWYAGISLIAAIFVKRSEPVEM